MSEILRKDNRELETRNRQALLKALVTTNLAYVAPYLLLAKVVDERSNNEAAVTVRIRDLKLLPREGYTVVNISFSVDMKIPGSEESAEATLYTFRSLSYQAFEPFVYMGKLRDELEVFAYSDDEEFLIEKFKGNGDEAVLNKIKVMATSKGMHSLARFVNLIELVANDRQETLFT